MVQNRRVGSSQSSQQRFYLDYVIAYALNSIPWDSIASFGRFLSSWSNPLTSAKPKFFLETPSERFKLFERNLICRCLNILLQTDTGSVEDPDLTAEVCSV
jgi:hypothetical protein